MSTLFAAKTWDKKEVDVGKVTINKIKKLLGSSNVGFIELNDGSVIWIDAELRVGKEVNVDASVLAKEKGNSRVIYGDALHIPVPKKPFKDALRDLLKEYNATIGVDLEGDTHGLETDVVVIIDNKTTVLRSGYSYVDASDLRRR